MQYVYMLCVHVYAVHVYTYMSNSAHTDEVMRSLHVHVQQLHKHTQLLAHSMYVCVDMHADEWSVKLCRPLQLWYVALIQHTSVQDQV